MDDLIIELRRKARGIARDNEPVDASLLVRAADEVDRLQNALSEMLEAFSMSGALDVDGMRRRIDAKKQAREVLSL